MTSAPGRSSRRRGLLALSLALAASSSSSSSSSPPRSVEAVEQLRRHRITDPTAERTLTSDRSTPGRTLERNASPTVTSTYELGFGRRSAPTLRASSERRSIVRRPDNESEKDEDPRTRMLDGHDSDDSRQLCSCSPTVFYFTLSLQQDCNTDDLRGNSGVGDTLCLLDTDWDDAFLLVGESSPDEMRRLSEDDRGGGGGGSSFSDMDEGEKLRRMEARAMGLWTRHPEDDRRSSGGRRLNHVADLKPVVITALQFLEVDTTPDLKVINQVNTYANEEFVEDAVVEFTSISTQLDPNVSVEDQTQFIPGGVILVLIGKNEAGQTLRNRLLWTYTLGCEETVRTVEEGDRYGFVTISDLSPAQGEFCPAQAAPEPTPTRMPTPQPTRNPTPKPSRRPTGEPSMSMNFLDEIDLDDTSKASKDHKSDRERKKEKEKEEREEKKEKEKEEREEQKQKEKDEREEQKEKEKDKREKQKEKEDDKEKREEQKEEDKRKREEKKEREKAKREKEKEKRENQKEKEEKREKEKEKKENQREKEKAKREKEKEKRENQKEKEEKREKEKEKREDKREKEKEKREKEKEKEEKKKKKSSSSSQSKSSSSSQSKSSSSSQSKSSNDRRRQVREIEMKQDGEERIKVEAKEEVEMVFGRRAKKRRPNASLRIRV